MTAGGISPFDGNPLVSPALLNGYRPTPSDFNGAQLVDDSTFPPDPSTMPTAELFNTIGLTLVSVGKAVAVAGFGINAGTSPTMAWWWTAANLIATNPFSVTRNSVGNYFVTWGANLFPVFGWPRCDLNVVLGAHNYAIGAVYGVNGVSVTTTQDGALTDLSFSVSIF